MTGILIGDVHPALDNPEPTAQKLGRQWGQGIDWDEIAETLDDQPEPEVAGADKAALEAVGGPQMAYAPQWITGSFRVSYGMKTAQFEAFAREMATRWFDEMRRKGWDLASSTELLVRPGPNPSVDLASGLAVPGYRDFLLSAQFVERHPETIRLEVPGELFEPLTLRQLPTSSGDEGD